MWCQYFVVKSNLVLFATRQSLPQRQVPAQMSLSPVKSAGTRHFNAVYGHRARAEDFMNSSLRNQKSAGRFAAQGRPSDAWHQPSPSRMGTRTTGLHPPSARYPPETADAVPHPLRVSRALEYVPAL